MNSILKAGGQCFTGWGWVGEGGGGGLTCLNAAKHHQIPHTLTQCHKHYPPHKGQNSNRKTTRSFPALFSALQKPIIRKQLNVD